MKQAGQLIQSAYLFLIVVASARNDESSELNLNAGNSGASYGVPIVPDSGDWFTAKTTKNLPLDQTVSGRLNSREIHIYAAQYTSAGGGTMRLEARAHGQPVPSAAAPITVSVKNGRGGYTFTLPLPTAGAGRRGESVGAGALSVSRIMCPADSARDATFVTLGVGGGGGDAVDYGYQLRLSVLNASSWFLSTDGASLTATLSPGDPAVFQYRWPEDPAVRAVRVVVGSGAGSCAGDPADGADEGDAGACASLAVQRAVCPLTLTVAELLSAARHLTFTGCGTVVVRRDHLPEGFYAAVMLHDDDQVCYPGQSRNASATRRKPVTVLATEYRVEYTYAVAPAALAMLFVLVGVLSFTMPCCRCAPAKETAASSPRKSIDQMASADVDGGDGDGASGAEAEAAAEMLQMVPETSAAVQLNSLLSHISVLFTCALLVIAFGANSVAMDLARERRTGDLDTCFRNHLCSHDVGVVPDLNHVLSNLPYVGAGLGFLLAVGAQRRRYRATGAGDGGVLGVPHDFDLFAALGAGLLLEGFTSALYHACPNSRNSHIDFFFIYYLYAALGAKVWQTRRGVTARFHYTPALLVAAITLLGSLQHAIGRTYALWAAVMVLHVLMSVTWAAQMYWRGKIGLFWPCRRSVKMGDSRARRIAITHLVLNVALAVTGLVAPSAFSDFSLYALLFFTLNSGVYVVFYIAMKKLRHGERPAPVSIAFMLVGLTVLVPALVVFVVYNPYNTEESAALSRLANTHCLQMGFFDAHDVWHFLSATALFGLLMGILTLDDDLLTTPRNQIPVF